MTRKAMECPETDTNAVRGRTLCYSRPVSEQDPLERPFDRHLRRLRRDRAAACGSDADYLYRHMADDLVERLDLVQRSFADALDLGCGRGYLTETLRARGVDVMPLDAGAAYATNGLQADEDRLPFPPGSFDLAVSASVLDTVNDLPGALAQIRRALRPDGLFLAAFLGAGSLPRLREAMRAADEAAAPRIHPQIDVRAAGDLLTRAGFALPVADAETLTVRFPSLSALVSDLRAMGATNILTDRSRRPIGRAGLAAAEAAFAALADADGKVAERFEIVHLSGWAPSPDQPRPARRGSASASLADALKAKR
jgi:NADH dehydrogenase [ubiquinone] 1 alpha subcomplex assembly factor 5